MDEIQRQLQAFAQKAQALQEQMKAADPKQIEELKGQLDEIKKAVQPLQIEYQKAKEEEARKGLEAEVQALRSEMDTLLKSVRRPSGFQHEFKAFGDDGRTTDPNRSKSLLDFVIGAKQGRYQAEYKAVDPDGTPAEKAMGTSTGSAGGYLVPEHYATDLLELRVRQSPMAALVERVPGAVFPFNLPIEAGGTTWSWVGENTTIPESTPSFGNKRVTGFYAKALSRIPGELVRRAMIAADQILRNALVRDGALFIDNAILNGTGTGQPAGVLSTAGITSAAATANLVDDIKTGIGRVRWTGLTTPNAIVMHSRRFQALTKTKESGTSNKYLLEPNADGSYSIDGVPLVADDAVPTNRGTATNEDVIIIGNFKDSALFEEQDVLIDVTDQGAGAFENWQYVFRGLNGVDYAVLRPDSFYLITGLTP